MTGFFDAFGYASQASAQAPGRVNLLGEHTDYNDGYVLPTTIAQFTRVEVARSRSDRHEFYSENLHRRAEYRSNEAVPEGFPRYIHGCIEVLRKRGTALVPLAVYVRSDIAMGSGLSSSAALEVAVLRALRILFNLDFDDVELARLGQQAEIEYAGVRCGILDQMASSLGDPQHMLFLDTRSLERRLLALPAPAELIVMDSGVPRTLAASGYNQRRAECEAAASLLGIDSLRDVRDAAQFQGLPHVLQQRVRHVFTENNRVLEAVAGVSVTRFGELMNDSHASLRDDYEVSIPPLDRLVALLQAHAGVYGARLTGAGFGGACVALAHPDVVSQVKRNVLDDYELAGYRGAVLV